MIINQCKKPLRGEVSIPGDKSISHRAVMFGALSEGDTRITHFLQGADCLSTISCFRQLGIDISVSNSEIIVHGQGLHGLKEATGMLDVGNSGTTMRLMSGILSGQTFASSVTGDASIQKRPMDRIMKPLRLMGADISGRDGLGFAPLMIRPSALHGISYQSPVASAQVKSCVLLAGLYADGETSVTEPALSRDHTERMLTAFGAKLHSEGVTCTVQPQPSLHGLDVDVPGDISSAAYFLCAPLLIPGSEVLVKNVGVNPTRSGIIDVLNAMGASIELLNERLVSGEPVADILVKASSLHGTTIEGEIIPRLIDELPMIAVLAAYAEGTTIIRDAAELKVKESDRISVVTSNLKRMGVDVTPTDDGMIINGGAPVKGAVIDSHMDHRIAMSFAVGALSAEGETKITQEECVNISYPAFFETLHSLTR